MPLDDASPPPGGLKVASCNMQVDHPNPPAPQNPATRNLQPGEAALHDGQARGRPKGALGPRRPAQPPYVVLTGNPNCGKTTLFNALTGLRAKVGNYAGVTVERKEGALLETPPE